MSSESNFAYALKYNTHFIVRNITGSSVNSPYQKTIFIFNYPINYGDTRDILAIPGIEETNIRASLLKGVLRHKLLCGDIQLVSSNIDLIQFSDKQRTFLQGFGFGKGIAVGYNELDGYVQSLFGGGGSGGITPQQHETLRQLIHFISDGPGDGFATGAVRIISPAGSSFPTSIIWYLDGTLTTKLVERLNVWDSNGMPSTITWNMYDLDGITIIHTIIDTITYVNNIFETTRVRTII